MSHAFIEEDTFVPGRRAVYGEPPNLQWALMDLDVEGAAKLEEIANEYSIDPQYLLGRWTRARTPAN